MDFDPTHNRSSSLKLKPSNESSTPDSLAVSGIIKEIMNPFFL